jgi:hypothetical protein
MLLMTVVALVSHGMSLDAKTSSTGMDSLFEAGRTLGEAGALVSVPVVRAVVVAVKVVEEHAFGANVGSVGHATVVHSFPAG